MKRTQILIPLAAMAFAMTPLFVNAQTTGSSPTTSDSKKMGNNADPGMTNNKTGAAAITDQAPQSPSGSRKGGDSSSSKGMGNDANPGMNHKDTAKAHSDSMSKSGNMAKPDPTMDTKGGRAPGTPGANSGATPTSPNNTNSGTGR